MIGEVFEQLLSKQLTSFIELMLNNNLTAYRKDQNWETSFIGLVERWKQAVEEERCRVLSTDMLKAFDSLHPLLLINKLRAYGFSNNLLTLMGSYFTNRKTGLGSVKKQQEMRARPREVVPGDRPPGSFSGTSFKTTYTSPRDENRLFMYADDHQLFSVAKATNEAESILTEEGNNISEWYRNNILQGNGPEELSQGFTLGD